MKKLVSIILVTGLFVSFVPCAWGWNTAVAPTGQTIYYNFNSSEQSITIVSPTGSENGWGSYTAPTGVLVLPDSIIHDGIAYPVVGLNWFAFARCSGLTSVIISNISNIAARAFFQCTGLTSVVIGDGVNSISWEVFANCNGLTNVSLGNNLTYIGQRAFMGCNNLVTVTIPDSVTTLETEAFRNCYGLTSFTLGNGLTSISNNLFQGCVSLDTVIVPNTITSIGSSAFSGCTGLTHLTIGGGVTSIGISAFSGCTALSTVVFNDGVTSIGDNVFSNCTNLTTVIFPSTVSSIGSNTFLGCTSLDSVNIPNSVTSIGSHAFEGCTGLSFVTIGKGVTSIGGCAFRNCTGLNSVIFNADSCTSVSSGATRTFLNCNNITSFVFGDNVKVIPPALCNGLSGLTTIVIPDSVVSIGVDAFRGCSGLTSVEYNAINSIINTPAHINYEDTRNRIFDNNSSINSFVFGDNVQVIPAYLCVVMTNLTSVTIPAAVTSIGSYAFRDCSGLVSIVFNADSCTSIGSGTGSGTKSAFYGCNISSVTFGNNVKVIPDRLCYHMSNLQSPLVIPNSVVSIGEYAFSQCTGLTSVNIGGGIVGKASFFQCTGLNSVTLGDGVTSIEQDAFYYCSGLTTITIPDSVTFIGTYAFQRCSGLTNITIGGGVDTISGYVFDGCTHLANIYMRRTVPPSVQSNTFVNVPSNANLHVPCGAGSSYQSAAYWNQFNIIEEFIYTFSVYSADTTRGMVNVVNTPNCSNLQAEVQAVPNEGYIFSCWSNGVTDNPYSFIVTSDVELIAIFRQPTVTVCSNDTAMGTALVNGSDSVSVLCGDTVTLMATANNGYGFVQWNDGDTNSARNVLVDKDMDFVAYFAPMYTVIVGSNDTTMGIATVDGLTSVSVINGDTVVLTAIPHTGYSFLHWSDNNADATRTIAVTSDTTFIAYFERVEGVDELEKDEPIVSISVTDGHIHVCLNGQPVDELRVYDLMGREVYRATHTNQTPAFKSGVYLVKVGDYAARRVVVIK